MKNPLKNNKFWSYFGQIFFCRGLERGLKILVSAVRFCPEPLSFYFDNIIFQRPLRRSAILPTEPFFGHFLVRLWSRL